MVVYSDELCHGIKGWTKPGHKYLKREWKNGRWRYYYSYKTWILLLKRQFAE